MEFQLKKFDSSLERRIVVGMVVSAEFLAEAATLFRPDLFRVPALKTAAQWCVRYWEEYGTAPGRHLQDIYESKRRSGEVPDAAAPEIESILSDLSNEYLSNPNLNHRYLLQQMERLMRSRALLALGEDLVALASTEKVEDAELALANFKPVAREGTSWSDPFNLSDDQIDLIFADGDVLFRFPGEVGELIGPVERDSFIGIQAPEKRGKTWWLWEFALRAVLSRCNVAFFSVGDMSAPQNWRRVHGWVLRSSRKRSGRNTLVPVLDCRLNQLGECRDCPNQDPVMLADGKLLELDEAQDHEPCIRCLKEDPQRFIGSRWYKRERVPDFQPHRAKAFLQQLSRRTGGKAIRLQCYPSNQANVRTIRTMLDLWEKQDGWVADVVVIDYADILAPEDAREVETRHRINATWAALRGLSTERSIAVITATQAAKTSYNKSNQDMGDVSEDKRKLGHVTSMIALNQAPGEKKMGLMRVNQLVVREDDFDSRENVVCLQCLAMSRPLLGSYWLK
jgi:hypothetical protein